VIITDPARFKQADAGPPPRVIGNEKYIKNVQNKYKSNQNNTKISQLHIKTLQTI